jgi:DNA-binding transcriptional MerR regulator
MSHRDLTIGEAAERTGLSLDTLRYYERIGLLPPIARHKGIRRYSEADLEWILFVAHLRATDMPVKDIRAITSLAIQGQSTMPQRRAVLVEHRAKIEHQIIALQEALQLIDKKLAYYDRALADKDSSEKIGRVA